jgi:hypothetical protein
MSGPEAKGRYRGNGIYQRIPCAVSDFFPLQEHPPYLYRIVYDKQVGAGADRIPTPIWKYHVVRETMEEYGARR